MCVCLPWLYVALLGNAQTTLKQALLSGYGDPTVRPGLVSRTCESKRDEVHAQMYVEKFWPLDQRKHTWRMDGYLRLWWHDPRLKYTVPEGQCIDYLDFTGNERTQMWYVSHADQTVSVPCTRTK